MRVITFLLVITCCLAGPVLYSQQVKLAKKVKAALDRVDKERFKGHIVYLADDKLKGRLPGREGFQMAVDYVVGQFRELGVAPGGENGAFLQKLVLRRATVVPAESSVLLKDGAGNADSLSIGKDIFILPNTLQPKMKSEAPVVFAGFGIEIPGKYSDYANLDIKGKIVVLLAGSPRGLELPSTLKAHFSNIASKMETAAAKGAVGVIMAQPNAAPLTRASNTVTVAMNPEKTAAYGRSAAGGLPLVTWISHPVLNRLFMNSGQNLQQVIDKLQRGESSSFKLPYFLSVNYSSTFTDTESHNVVGLIEGSDKTLKDEYVVHTAHLDHVGIGRPVGGDSIYNGAHDNASGVASLLEIARIYRQMGSKPRRSILIVMVTAEEMGLLGSAYFAGNPTVPRSQIVANVNTDMPTLIAPLLSVAPLGAEHSSLEKNVAFACKQLGIEMQKDPMPSEVRFIRSDQYSFVLQGIPALHIKYGTKTSDPGFDLVKFTEQWRDQHYHKPSDEINNNFDLEAARKYVQLNFLVSYSIAQTTARPSWNKGDFFDKGALVEKTATP